MEHSKRILTSAGKTEIADQLRPSGNGIASHCMVCGIVQGNFYVGQEALERVYWEDDEAAFDVLATGAIEYSEWQRIEDGEFPGAELYDFGR